MSKMKPLEKLKANFNMNTTEEIYFWKSEWERFNPSDRLCNVSLPYLAFRFGMLSYFLGGTIYNMYCTHDLNLYFIFLTNWSFTLQLIYTALFFFRLVWVRWKRENVENRLFSSSAVNPTPSLPWAEKLIWVGVNLIVVVPYVVTLGYWAFIFQGSFKDYTTCQVASDFIVHALNSPVALLDFLVMAVPIRISHMIFPIIVGFLYVFFSGMYEVGNGQYSQGAEYIYAMLDWRNKPGMASVASVIGIIGAGLLHLVMGWGVYRLRVILARKLVVGGRTGRGNLTISPDDITTTNEARKGGSNMAFDNPTLVQDSESGLKESDQLETKSLPGYNTFSIEAERTNKV